MFDNANSNNNFFTSSSLDDSHCESSFSVNPANGLPMIGDSMIDVSGILTEVQEITMTYKGTVKFYNKEKRFWVHFFKRANKWCLF